MSRHPVLYSMIVLTLVMGLLAGGFFFLIYLFSRSQEGVFPSFGDIAVVKIEGVIMDSTDILKELDHYRKSKSIKAVVLRIDSPGGAVGPSQEIFEEVKKLKTSKKVLVSMGTVAASGGYYIACAADKIMAMPGSITGSIGVIMQSFGLEELAKVAKIEARVVKSGAYKDVGNPFREQTPEDRMYLQSFSDDMYEQFKADVASQRKLSPEQINQLAEGKIYTGKQAAQLGLIDGLGNLYDVIDEAKRMSGLSEEAHVIWPREEEISFGSFIGSLFGGVFHENGLLKKILTMKIPRAYYLISNFDESTSL